MSVTLGTVPQTGDALSAGYLHGLVDNATAYDLRPEDFREGSLRFVQQPGAETLAADPPTLTTTESYPRILVATDDSPASFAETGFAWKRDARTSEGRTIGRWAQTTAPRAQGAPVRLYGARLDWTSASLFSGMPEIDPNGSWAFPLGGFFIQETGPSHSGPMFLACLARGPARINVAATAPKVPGIPLRWQRAFRGYVEPYDGSAATFGTAANLDGVLMGVLLESANASGEQLRWAHVQQMGCKVRYSTEA